VPLFVALWEEAAEAMRAAASPRQATAPPLQADERALVGRAVALAATCPSSAAYAQAEAEGRAMTLEQAVAYALDEQPSV
jgi:hypothetical protein